MKVALVYDRVNKWGGAERVLLALHELFPDAPLFTSVYNHHKATWAKPFTVIPSFLQSFPFAQSAHEYYPLLMPLAFESFSFDDYDVVITITSEAAKGIITKPSTKHICYCLTPTRYLWSGYEQYFASTLIKTLATPAVSYLRTWDMVAAKRPDHFIAISREVQNRIKKYYQQPSEVIYPPLNLAVPERYLGRKDKGYFLVVSRLVPYKRVDLAIDACNQLGLPLKIIGTGSELESLKQRAGNTIEFLGSVTDAQLQKLYSESRAFIFPGLEDFGLTMVESLAFGKPVIAFNAGGAKEIVKDGVTGVLFSHQTVQSLSNALQKSLKVRYNARACQKQAEQFSKEQFKKSFTRLLENVL